MFMIFIIVNKLFQLNMGKLSDKMFELVLTPTANKHIKKYKNTTAYKELERQVKHSVEALESMAKNLEEIIKEQEITIKKAKSFGWDIKPWNSTEELLKQIRNRPGREEALKKLGL